MDQPAPISPPIGARSANLCFQSWINGPLLNLGNNVVTLIVKIVLHNIALSFTIAQGVDDQAIDYRQGYISDLGVMNCFDPDRVRVSDPTTAKLHSYPPPNSPLAETVGGYVTVG